MLVRKMKKIPPFNFNFVTAPTPADLQAVCTLHPPPSSNWIFSETMGTTVITYYTYFSSNNLKGLKVWIIFLHPKILSIPLKNYKQLSKSTKHGFTLMFWHNIYITEFILHHYGYFLCGSLDLIYLKLYVHIDCRGR